MKHKFLLVIQMIACSLGATLASAQVVYKCGSSYSQTPCPGGVGIQAQDLRSAAQREQALKMAQREAKAGTALEKARKKQEAQAALESKKAQQALEKATKARAQAAAKKKDKDADEDPADGVLQAKKKRKKKEPTYFTAKVPVVPKDGDKDAP